MTPSNSTANAKSMPSSPKSLDLAGVVWSRSCIWGRHWIRFESGGSIGNGGFGRRSLSTEYFGVWVCIRSNGGIGGTSSSLMQYFSVQSRIRGRIRIEFSSSGDGGIGDGEFGGI